MQVNFFNTYEPVTTFYRDLLPYLASKGIVSEVFISAAEYRQGGRSNLSGSFSDEAIRIRKLPALGLQPERRLHKALIILTYVLGCLCLTLFGPSPDINFFLTQPPLFNLWGWVLKKLRGQKYICLVMDIYPDVAVLDGLLPPNGWLTRQLTRISRFTLQHAEAVIVIGRCMAERVAAMGVEPQKIHFIPNWTNPKMVYPVRSKENQLRQALGLQDKFIVLYSGNMGISHYFDDLLEVICRSQEVTGLHFVFIGAGARRKEVEGLIASQNLQNITLLPFQPLEDLAETLSLGDVHFISLREGFEGLVVPSKVYGALAAGRAVIYQGNKNGEIARMITEEGVGTIIELKNPNQLEQVILHYMQSSELTKKQDQAAFQLTQGKHAANQILEKYYQVISKNIHE